jgi:hypothetical protein
MIISQCNNIYFLNNLIFKFSRNETWYEKSLIVIFNTEKKIPIINLSKNSFCLIYSNGEPKWHRAYVEGIIGEKHDYECKISVYRLFCPQLSINKNDKIEEIDLAIRLTLQAEPFYVKIFKGN